MELGAICADLRGLFALRAEQQGSHLEFILPAESPLWLEADAPRLEQILINLIGNALKFAREGRITVRVDLLRALEGEVELRFAVSDTGPGIPADEQARLFQPYVQLPGGAKAAEPGSGLGLSISRRLVALFGGELALRSARGEGAEFHFSLRLRRAVPPQAIRLAQAPPPGATDLRLLAADDNSANQEVLRGLLQTRCRHLVIVGSGTAALRALEREKFEVALIDLEMPDLDGLEVARIVRSWRGTEASRGCRLVAFSAHGRSQMWSACAGAGFDDFVEKPIDRGEFWRAVTTRSRPAANEA